MVQTISDHGSYYAEVVCVTGNVREKLTDGDAALAVSLERERRFHQAAVAARIERERKLERRGLPVIASEARFRVEGIQMRRPALHEK